MRDSQSSGEKQATFEETYPHHEFAELVRIVLAIADWIGRRRRHIAPSPGTRRTALAPDPHRRLRTHP
jgi:hypothetical protein